MDPSNSLILDLTPNGLTMGKQRCHKGAKDEYLNTFNPLSLESNTIKISNSDLIKTTVELG